MRSRHGGVWYGAVRIPAGRDPGRNPRCVVIRRSGRVVSERKHLVSEQRHVSSEQRHVVSERNHLVSEQRHVVSEQRHVSSERNHVVSERRHAPGSFGHAVGSRGPITARSGEPALGSAGIAGSIGPPIPSEGFYRLRRIYLRPGSVLSSSDRILSASVARSAIQILRCVLSEVQCHQDSPLARHDARDGSGCHESNVGYGPVVARVVKRWIQK